MSIIRSSFLLWSLIPAVAAEAQSTVTYKYDAQGRLVASRTSGGPNNGLAVDVGIDGASNRTSYKVSGASGVGGGGGNNGDGASAQTAPRIIVVPLNGLTIIPIG